MDIEICTDAFYNFLCKAKLDKLVQDLRIQTKDNILFAKFMDVNNSMYCEIYERNLKIHETGEINISSLGKLLDSLSRINGKMIRIKSNKSHYIVTDATNVNLKLTQSFTEELVDSYKKVANLGSAHFVKENLTYLSGKTAYKNGFEVDLDDLLETLKDAKSFGFEIYEFSEEEKGLSCTIKSPTRDIQDKLTRKLNSAKKITEGKTVIYKVGAGFREIINAISKEKSDQKRIIKIYFQEKSGLITDGEKYFYNLHQVPI